MDGKKHIYSYSFAFHSVYCRHYLNSKPKVPLYPHEDDNYEIIYIHFVRVKLKILTLSSYSLGYISKFIHVYGVLPYTISGLYV